MPKPDLTRQKRRIRHGGIRKPIPKPEGKKISISSAYISGGHIRRSKPLSNGNIFTALVAGSGTIVAVMALTSMLISLEEKKRQDLAKNPESAVQEIAIPTWTWVFLLCVIGLFSLGILAYLFLRYKLRRSEVQAMKDAHDREAAAIDSALDRLREKMTLPSLVELNRLMLERYHGIATEQADSSYVSSKRAMWFAFTWVIGCSIAGVTVAVTTGDKIILTALAAIGGAISTFLSRTYIKVYERSLEQLNQYFSQPLLNSHYLTAERVIEGMTKSEQDVARKQLLTQLLAGSKSLTTVNGKVESDAKGTNSRRKSPKNSPRVTGK